VAAFVWIRWQASSGLHGSFALDWVAGITGIRKGQQVKVPTPTQRQSATLFGALHLRTQRFYWKRATRGTSTRFLEFLHQLHQRFPEALLILILDNATIHKSRAVKRFLTQHDWVALEH